ncbi:MAG: hypothetical protein MJB14_11915 [Spirochaetes bacterium]|nr:hypothetical protein [Spirochaetota bacterium]
MSLTLEKKTLEEEKYLKVIGCSFSFFKNRIRLLYSAFEDNVIKLIVEVVDTQQTEIIHLKNFQFFTYDELIDDLTEKLHKLLKNVTETS